MTPLVSVIVPNYNHARFLRQRLDSIFNQTFTNFEVILLDDKSTDNSIEVLDSYQDERISHRIYNSTNSGSTFPQWKKGLELAKGELIWIAESDDWADVTFLEKMVPLFSQYHHLAVAYSEMDYVNENGELINETYAEYASYAHPTLWKDSHYYSGKEYLERFMINKCMIVNASGVLFKKNLGLKHIDKILNYRQAGDWLFWNSILAENGAYVYFRGKEKLNFFRHSSQSTRNYPTIEKKENGLIERTNVLFHTLNIIDTTPERNAQKKREMLDWWAKDHSIVEALKKSFKKILTTEMFQDISSFTLYKHYIKYKIKNTKLIKSLRK